MRVIAAATFDVPFPTLEACDPIPENAPKRLVCVIPSLTETLCALGFEDRLVGRDRWSDWPESIRRLPSVGDQRTLSAEKIADLRPDLVVMWPKLGDVRQALTQSFKLNVVAPETEADSAFAGIIQVADSLAVRSRGEKLVEKLQKEQVRIQKRFRERPSISMLVVLDRGQGSLYVIGDGSFLDSLFETIHATNVAPAGGGPWKAMSAEALAETKPDVILDLSLGGGAADVTEADVFWRRFPHFPAVKQGRVFVAHAPVLVRPGPRFYAAAEALAETIHGP